jgi:hypothetical protein
MTYFQWMFFTDIMNLLSFFYFTGFVLQVITDFICVNTRTLCGLDKLIRAFYWPLMKYEKR